MKPIHGEHEPIRTPEDAQEFPPIECEFKKGDIVTFTNCNKVKFHGLKITGFSPTVQSSGRFIYLNFDCWWFAENPKNLKLEA